MTTSETQEDIRLELVDDNDCKKAYQEVADRLGHLGKEEADKTAEEIINRSTSKGSESWRIGYYVARWMLDEHNDPSCALRLLGAKKHGCYEKVTHLVYNISNLSLPPGSRARLYTASLYAAGKTLNASLMQDVLTRSAVAEQAIDELDPNCNDPGSNKSVRRLSLDLAKINIYMQLNDFKQVTLLARSTASTAQPIRHFEDCQRGATGIVSLQSLIKIWSLIFADEILSGDIKAADKSQAKITRCSLALCRCWQGRIRKRRELPYMVEGLVPMHLTLISRQALRGIQTQGMEPSLIATAALSLMSFAFRPEGPRQRVETTEFLIRNYIADKLSIDSSTIPEDTALLISGRMSGDFISAY